MSAVMPPYFKHYTADDVQETEFLSILATGVYHRLQIKFFQLGELPNNEDKIRKLAGAATERKWPAIRVELMENGVFTSDWRNPRWEALLEKTRGISTTKSAAARTRWDRPGGRADDMPPFAPPPVSYDGPDADLPDIEF